MSDKECTAWFAFWLFVTLYLLGWLFNFVYAIALMLLSEWRIRRAARPV